MNKKYRFLFIAFFLYSLTVSAGVVSEQFEKLEEKNSSNSDAKIAVLLRPYGEISEFKLTDESSVYEECTSKTQIRTKTTCDKTTKFKKVIYFAEGKGLLCKIFDNLNSIKCLLK